MTDLERLLVALESMTEDVRYMNSIPGASEHVPVPPGILLGMENSARLMRRLSENVRALAAKIAASAPRGQRPERLN